MNPYDPPDDRRSSSTDADVPWFVKTFKIAALNSVFAVHDDGIMAKRKIYELSGVPDPEAPGFQLQFKLKHAGMLAVCSVSVLIAVIIWLRNT